ncbi:MAG: valine--tRNA ligase [Ardenticatenia bacterium]|nr:MAG: valine--tRNA ligase [Ardenticatenia bacterium]
MKQPCPIDTTQMSKAYDPHAVETLLYEWWEKQGYFKPEIAPPDARPFVIAMPPPNVTGELHMGHAITTFIEDLMIRYHRMQGRAALWVPGTDHAGIATQLQVERMLAREGLSRQQIGREEFLRRTWEWKEKYGGRIQLQLRRMGASCDWDRERFTLDEGLSRAVRECFVRLYEKGLIYRGEYLVNWSPGLQTAVSDLEVEYREEEATLYYFKYPIAGARLEDGPGVGYIPVATVRPETILGDTAVAVHPDDERYRHLIGKTCLVPILNRPIPVIHDTYVSMDFGTGALKITPGHDPNDFEIGQRHGLPIINVFNPDVTMNENAGPYAGLDRYECRRRLWADMEAAGLTIKTEKYVTQIPHSQRGGEVVEPMLSTQWFVRMKPLAEAGLTAVRDRRIVIIPERFTKVYYNWLENIRDWCISRQLWWGHRIPVWYCQECGQMIAARVDPTTCTQCGSTRLEQDPDVLDTWFSSGLWPFSTLGWPDDTPDLRRFYPTDVMETGYDILFFWVARMIMQGLEMTGQVPFRVVYLHGLVRDAQGRKMSKTAGNVIDPLEMIERYGTDALRFSLLTGTTPGNDINLSEERIVAGRNFANKIWNMVRFVVGHLRQHPVEFPEDVTQLPLALADRWILSRHHEVIATVTRLIEAYQFGEAGRQLYEFMWGELADWYIEMAKIPLTGQDEQARDTTLRVLVYILERCLRLLHPYMPFVTEAAWQHLPHRGDALIIARWPTPGARDEEAETMMQLVMEVIRAIRNARTEYNVEVGRHIPAVIVAGEKAALFRSQADILIQLAHLDAEQLDIVAELEAKPQQALALVVSGVEVYLPLAGMIDLEAERVRLSKELEKVQEQLARSERTLSNPNFVNKAPPEVVEKERAKMTALQEQAGKLRERLHVLTGEM